MHILACLLCSLSTQCSSIIAEGGGSSMPESVKTQRLEHGVKSALTLKACMMPSKSLDATLVSPLLHEGVCIYPMNSRAIVSAASLAAKALDVISHGAGGQIARAVRRR